MKGLNERSLSIIIPNILWLETLLGDTPFMVSGTGGWISSAIPRDFLDIPLVTYLVTPEASQWRALRSKKIFEIVPF